jgi:hypothetical protein
MNYQFLNIQNILLIILTITVMLLILQNILLQKRFKRIFINKDNNSLEKITLNQIKKTAFLEEEIKKIKNDIANIRKDSEKMIQKVKIKRYNPFKELGSDQSFTISFLDGTNNGLLITGLHSREGVRVYAKPVEKGDSKYKLSSEEQEILSNKI